MVDQHLQADPGRGRERDAGHAVGVEVLVREGAVAVAHDRVHQHRVHLADADVVARALHRERVGDDEAVVAARHRRDEAHVGAQEEAAVGRGQDGGVMEANSVS